MTTWLPLLDFFKQIYLFHFKIYESWQKSTNWKKCHPHLGFGSFHAKWTTGCQVTPSDFAHIHTICSSIGRMNTQKKSVANSFPFWKYSCSKICPDPPLFGFHASRHWFIWSLTCIYSSLQQDTKVKIATWANFQPYFKNLKSKTLYHA